MEDASAWNGVQTVFLGLDNQHRVHLLMWGGVVVRPIRANLVLLLALYCQIQILVARWVDPMLCYPTLLDQSNALPAWH